MSDSAAVSDTIDRMRTRARVIQAVRRFFDERGFLEVDTPVALTSPAPEPHVDAPAVELEVEGRRCRRFLQTSPELPMKRLLAAGCERIYQIAPVFRDTDFGPLHRPEFRLLEWYRRGASYEALLEDCEALLGACAEACGRGLRFATQGLEIDLTPPFRRMSMEEAFQRHAGFSIIEALEPELLRARLTAAGIRFADGDAWDDLFHRIYLTRVEPAVLADPRPLFLTHYPAPLAALARRSPHDARVAERFELFAGGLELANGFGELTDAVEQRQRFVRDRARRVELGKHDYPLDERFLSALDHLPPSAGIALGVERLLMLLLDADDIDTVSFIPWSES